MINNIGLFQTMLDEFKDLYMNAMLQYVENKASGRFQKAHIAICNAREFAKAIRSAKRNLEREQLRLGMVVAVPGPCCPECIQGAA